MRTKTLTIGIAVAAATSLLLVGRSSLSGPGPGPGPKVPPAPTFTPPGPPTLPNPPTFPPGAKPDGAYVAALDTAVLPANQQVNVVRLALPPNGSYEIVAKVVVTNDSADNPISVACALSTSPSADDTTIDYSSVTVAPQSRLPLTLLATYRYAFTVGTPVVWVACRSSGPGSARWTKLVATPVSKIN